MCDPIESGSLSRDSLYKAMALCALGQQGKGVDEKLLLKYGDSGKFTQLNVSRLLDQ